MLTTLPAGQESRVKRKQEVIEEAQKESKTLHVETLMDLCNLKNLNWTDGFPKYEGRVVLRGDVVKDDSDSYALFTESECKPNQMIIS